MTTKTMIRFPGKVAARMGVSVRTLVRYAADPDMRFPAIARFGPRDRKVEAHELEAWIEWRKQIGAKGL